MGDYPDSLHATEAKFFGRVAGWRALVASPVDRANPQPALEAWKRLDESLGEPDMKPYTAPDKFANDIWAGIQKLQEDVVGHAKDSLNPDDASEAERWLAVAEDLTSSLTKYRPKGIKSGEGVTDTSTIRADIAKAKARIEALAAAKAILAADESTALAQARVIFRRAGLADDLAARTLLTDAETRLRGRTRYVALSQTVPARRLEVFRSAGVLPTRLLTGEVKPSGRVGFFQTGGLLTAFDAGDGSVIWTDAIDPDDGEIPESLAVSERRAESVAYLARRDGSAALCVREKSGGLIWEQPLGSMTPRGRPLVVRGSLMLAVFDPSRPALGLVARFDLDSGEWLGNVEFGRPLANTGASRPGSTLWAVPAESDELIVVKVAEPDGPAIDPVLANGVPTGHARGSISAPPILGGGDGPDPVFAVLFARDGPAATRVIPVSLGGASISGGPFSLIGWASGPIAFDGETATLATDAGRVYRVGIGLPGGVEPAAFVADEPFMIERPDPRPVFTRVAMASGGTAAVLEGGSLYLIRSRLRSKSGLAFEAFGKPEPVGQSIGAASGLDAVFTLTRLRAGQAARLASFSPFTGAKLWERQIGLGVLARATESDRLRWFDSDARLLELDGPSAASAITARPPTVRPVALKGWPSEAQPTSAIWRGEELFALVSTPGGPQIIHGPRQGWGRNGRSREPAIRAGGESDEPGGIDSVYATRGRGDSPDRFGDGPVATGAGLGGSSAGGVRRFLDALRGRGRRPDDALELVGRERNFREGEVDRFRRRGGTSRIRPVGRRGVFVRRGRPQGGRGLGSSHVRVGRETPCRGGSASRALAGRSQDPRPRRRGPSHRSDFWRGPGIALAKRPTARVRGFVRGQGDRGRRRRPGLDRRRRGLERTFRENPVNGLTPSPFRDAVRGGDRRRIDGRHAHMGRTAYRTLSLSRWVEAFSLIQLCIAS